MALLAGANFNAALLTTAEQSHLFWLALAVIFLPTTVHTYGAPTIVSSKPLFRNFLLRRRCLQTRCSIHEPTIFYSDEPATAFPSPCRIPVELRYAILQSTSFSIYRRCTQLGIPVVITKGPLGIWPTVRVVQQATGPPKAVNPVDVDAATTEPRDLRRSKSEPRFTAMTCQASALRLRKYSGNLQQ